MKPSTLAGAIALNGALIALMLSGALEKPHTEVERPPVIVQLLPPMQPTIQATPKPSKPEQVKAQPRPVTPKPEPAKPEQRSEPPQETAKVTNVSPAKDLPPLELPRTDASKSDQAQTDSSKTEQSGSNANLESRNTNKKQEDFSSQGKGVNSSAAPDKLFKTRLDAAYDSASFLKRRGAQGKVVLRFLLRSDGTIDHGSIEVKSSSGFPGLDKLAVDVLKNSPKFSPEIRDGKPVEDVVDLPIVFALR